MTEYEGKKVSVLIPAKDTIDTDEMWPDVLHALGKAAARQGMVAADPRLAWSGTWAEAAAHPEYGSTFSVLHDSPPLGVDYAVHVFEATAREEASA